MRFVVSPLAPRTPPDPHQGPGLGASRSAASRSSRRWKRPAATGARLGARGHPGSAPGAPPLDVLLSEPRADAHLVQAPRVRREETPVRLSHPGAADPIAREVRAVRAEGDAAILGACLDLAVSAEAERRRRAAACAHELVRRRVQLSGEGLQSRHVLLGPSAVHGTRAAVGAADPREARVDRAVIDDHLSGHRTPNLRLGA